jgi:hypothetical protein
MRFMCLFILVLSTVFSSNERMVDGDEKNGDKICVIFVCDRNDVARFKSTYTALRNEGQYTGDVCLIATGGLQGEEGCLNFFQDSKNHVVNFDTIETPNRTIQCAYKPKFVQAQMQKFHVFNVYFKQWDYLFYIDCGMKIHGNVNEIIAMREIDTFLAPGDLNIKGHTPRIHSYDFVAGKPDYDKLVSEYGMTNQYPRSTMMLYASSVIKNDTCDVMVDLLNTFPSGRSDQSYISLYFVHINPVWKPITREDGDKYYYDFCPRVSDHVYIMHKYHMLGHKCPLCNTNEAILMW